MKSLSVISSFIILLLAVSAASGCEEVLYVGNCSLDNPCDGQCKLKHGKSAHGICQQIGTSNEKCVCDYPCP